MGRKGFAAGVVLLLMTGLVAAYTMASGNYKVIVDGREMELTNAPQVVKGKIMLPIECLQNLGYQVNWDLKNQNIDVTPPIRKPSEVRLQLLESALTPQNAADAADTWARGVQQRNGALQYVALAPELQKQKIRNFEDTNWVTGVSSPWVQKYTVTSKSRPEKDIYLYEARFDMATSTGPAGTEIARLTVSKQQDEYGQGRWGIKEITRYELQSLSGTDLLFPLPGWSIDSTNGENIIIAGVSGKGQQIGRIDRLSGPFLPNHSTTISQKAIKTAIGNGNIYVLELSMPAASKDQRTWQEVHSLVPYGQDAYMDLWITVKDGQRASEVVSQIETIWSGAAKFK